MLLVANYIRMTTVLFLKKKSSAFENFKTYKEMAETNTKLRIECLRSDNGEEFTSKYFMEFYSEHGIKRKFSIPRTPQQNGVVERKNKTV
jgi:transposase InsO family protein